MEDMTPDYKPVFTDVYQYYGNSLASFTNIIDDLILKLSILIKLRVQADKCKMIVTFDTLPESKILDAGNTLILSNFQKPWTIVCKDVGRIFKLEYSADCTLNRSELCECSLTAGNYLLSQTASNCGDMPEAKDGFFTTYYAFNKIVLDVLMEKFNIQVDDDTVTQ